MKKNSVFIIIAICLLSVLVMPEILIGGTDNTVRPFEITRVGLDKKVFNPSQDEMVNLGFEITKQADIQVSIYDLLGQEVRRFNIPDLEKGRHSITWDGRGTDDKQACGDVFLYVIEAKTEDGQRAIYNTADETGGIEVQTLEYTLDKETGKIEYVLPKACMIRLRAGLKDGMLAQTIFDWRPSTAGRHCFNWDGKDSTGQINLLRHPELDVRLTCYTLPSNTVITTGKIIPFDSEEKFTKEKSETRNRLWSTKDKYLHYKHDPRICHEPGFKVLFPAKDNPSEKTDPAVSGAVPVRIELDERDIQHLINTRFEIMVYVDGIFISEAEEGSSPYTFYLDTSGFKKGPCILTVNILSYDGHIGTVSRKIIIGD